MLFPEWLEKPLGWLRRHLGLSMFLVAARRLPKSFSRRGGIEERANKSFTVTGTQSHGLMFAHSADGRLLGGGDNKISEGSPSERGCQIGRASCRERGEIWVV